MPRRSSDSFYKYQPLCTEGKPSLICINVRWVKRLYWNFWERERLTYKALIAWMSERPMLAASWAICLEQTKQISQTTKSKVRPCVRPLLLFSPYIWAGPLPGLRHLPSTGWQNIMASQGRRRRRRVPGVWGYLSRSEHHLSRAPQSCQRAQGIPCRFRWPPLAARVLCRQPVHRAICTYDTRSCPDEQVCLSFISLLEYIDTAEVYPT